MEKPPFLRAILPWLCLPVVALQGRAARRASFRMAPADGPLRGDVPAAKEASGPEIRLLILGDSSAAGVGAAQTSETLGPLLAEELATRTGSRVLWRMAGSNSATAADLRDHVVPNLAREDWTHVLICVGTNDAKNFVTGRAFKSGFGGLLYALKARFPDARLVWSPPIDMRTFPALQPFLGAMLEIRAQVIRAQGAQLCFERYAVAADPLPVEDATGFAADGFHANGLGYRIWAKHVAPIFAAL